MDLKLIEVVRSCDICAEFLPLQPRPIVQFHSEAKVLIAGQAPGLITHDKGMPFNDASGERLREWMGVDTDTFYNEQKVAIVPMGFCYPGTGKSGDLPPRKECALAWREKVMASLTKVRLTLVIGQYAQRWHIPEARKKPLTTLVADWRDYGPSLIPLPHPSPRNNIWLKKNPWFVEELLPVLRDRVRECLNNKCD